MTRKIGKELVARLKHMNDSFMPITPSESDSPQPVASTPDAASTPGEGTRQAEGTEPVAWVAFASDGSESGVTALNREAVEEVAAKFGWHVAPLYRSPALTDAERDAIMGGAGLLNWCDQNGHIGDGGRKDLETLRGLLDRTRRVTP